MSKNDAAVIAAVACPQCKARKGKPCLYLPVPEPVFHKTPHGYYSDVSQAKRRTRFDLNGTPTKQPHMLRRNKFYALQARWRTQPSPVPEVSQVLVAVRDFDRAEYDQTKAWLRANVMILLELTNKNRETT